MARVALGISRTPSGYLAVVHVGTIFRAKRFPPHTLIRVMQAWREETRVRLRACRPQRQRGTLAADVERYLKTVTAMPTYRDRVREIRAWVGPFGTRARDTVTAEEIRAQLHVWRAGKAASTVNHRRTALLHLYHVLDGRHAPNPARDVPPFREPVPTTRAIPLDTLKAILARLPSTTHGPRLSTVRIGVLAYTGMRPSELMRMQPQDVDLEHGSCWVPTIKGGPARLVVLNQAGIEAWRVFIQQRAWGRFSVSSLRHVFARRVQALGERNVRLYDLRHTWATALLEAGADLADVQAHLGHSTPRMTRRYAVYVGVKLRRALAALDADHRA